MVNYQKQLKALEKAEEKRLKKVQEKREEKELKKKIRVLKYGKFVRFGSKMRVAGEGVGRGLKRVQIKMKDYEEQKPKKRLETPEEMRARMNKIFQ
jgi:Sec-independent protein translocase protein TatA